MQNDNIYSQHEFRWTNICGPAIDKVGTLYSLLVMRRLERTTSE